MRTKDDRPISEVIADLERAALAGHRHGQTWMQFYGANWTTGLVYVARAGSGVYEATVQRLLHLLATGDASGRLAAGDDSDSPEPIPFARPISDTATTARLQPGVFA